MKSTLQLVLAEAANAPAPVLEAPVAAPPRPAQRESLAVEELRLAARSNLNTLLEDLLAAAPADLLKRASVAAGEHSRRRPLELIRTLDMERARLLRTFAREFDRSFHVLAKGNEVDAEAMARTTVEALEEQVALSQLARHTTRLLGAPLAALSSRILHAHRALGVEISPRALSPQSLCDAWRATLRTTELCYDERLLLHPLFERCVLQRLGPVIEEALVVLDRHGWKALGPDAMVPADARTLAALQAAATQSHTPADAALATVLLETQTPALRQRLGLVGALFSEMLADPNLAGSFAALFESLRFVVIKAALADPRFFRGGHPLRERIAQAAALGACARTGGSLGLRHMEHLLRTIPAQADISAGELAPALDNLAPLGENEVLAFLAAVREETAARAETLQLRVQRIVAQELEVQSLGLRIPATAKPLIDGGLAPLLASRLLRFGVDHRLWHDSVDRLGQVLHTLAPRRHAERSLARGELADVLRADFAEAGLPATRIESLVDALQRAWAELDRHEGAAPSRVAGDDQALLSNVLQPDAWFRVYHTGAASTQWLRLDHWTPGEDEVSFSGFDRSQQYRVSIRTLSEDLRHGRTEPVDPAPESLTALLALRRR